MEQKPTIVFFGTPEFAVPALKSLIESDCTIAAVVTQPDKRRGRNKPPISSPVKEVALEHSIPTIEPEKITDEVIAEIKESNPNLFVIVAYGKILPQELLDIPEHGSVNIHPSLLPLYRGPSPLQSQILDGVTESGVCIMLIDEEMDHGPLLASHTVHLTGNETYESLGTELFELGAAHLPETIENYLSGDITPQEQDHSKATVCKLIKKEEGSINWNKPAEHIEKMTRAFTPWPSAYSSMNEIDYKILKATVASITSSESPGTLFTEEKHLYASAGDKTVLEILEIQPAGKSPMPAESFIQGYLKQ